MKTRLAIAAVLAALAHPAFAADTLKLAIGQRGLWDSSFAEIGTQAGIFAKHGLELQGFYTSGGGETQQAVISGSAGTRGTPAPRRAGRTRSEGGAARPIHGGSNSNPPQF